MNEPQGQHGWGQEVSTAGVKGSAWLVMMERGPVLDCVPVGMHVCACVRAHVCVHVCPFIYPALTHGFRSVSHVIITQSLYSI